MITVQRLPPRMKISQQPQPAYRRWLAAAWQLGLLAGGGLVVVFVFGGLVMSGLQFVGVSTTIALLVGLTAGCVFVIYNFDWSEIWSDVVSGLSRSSAEADALQVIDQVVVSNIKKAWEFDCDCLDDFWPGYLLALQEGTFLAVWGQALDQVVDYDYDDDVCLFQEIVLDIDVSTKEILNVNWSGERIQMSGLIPFGPLGLGVSDGFSVVPAEVAQSVIAQGIHYPGD